MVGESLALEGLQGKTSAPAHLGASQVSFFRTVFTNNKADASLPLLAADSASSVRLEGVQMASNNAVLRHIEVAPGAKVEFS